MQFTSHESEEHEKLRKRSVMKATMTTTALTDTETYSRYTLKHKLSLSLSHTHIHTHTHTHKVILISLQAHFLLASPLSISSLSVS